MTEPVPLFDELERGHVVLASDPFKAADEATRPWLVVNNEHHPFDGEQYIVMGLTTQTWYEHRIPLEEDDYCHRRAPRTSSIVPHALASLHPDFVTDYVCRIRTEPIDAAVEVLLDYL
ncbi:type II toxin-antitoxin system PemK/MazF family toxin [Natronobiforma cellulositropha]|uniref:type II toxin-antitoxin system PemK/MazF family toxin n=1 Tax=Natronobiforma cellulositropha TaxID=1679076 RepID=UPI0021D58949|nr:type II toxin-antitoxin system PemK/MazF family toxin [Natronobiforma cellulositropha]